ncbi:MAG: ribosome maturation factor RimP [Clostridia bacterium]|nr:ribosome maturation factor RimP [Clostridia bacterium]
MKVKTDEQIAEFLKPFAEELGVSVYEVHFKQGKNQLEITIDKKGGVDLDTCAAFMEKINEPLDEFDPTLGEPYTLNVSSKGIDWAFKTEQDFLSHIGEKVEVKLVNSVRGKKFYDGILTAYDGKTATLKVDEKTTFTLDMKNVLKMNEYIDFE